MSQAPVCVGRPVRARQGLDIVRCAAGIAVLGMLALYTVRSLNGHFDLRLSGRLMSISGDAIWWAYWGSVALFGLIVIRRWRNTYFRWRTAATMISQTLFGIVLIGPLRGELGVPPFWQRLHLTWPLHMSVLTPHLEKTMLPGFIYGALMSLVIWPLIAHFVGLRYCSWFCFCGNLAESAGDSFRTKGPKGPSAQPLDNTAYGILGLAALVTVARWFGASRPFEWYDLLVSFGLGVVVGMGLYPLLGSRVWCRFYCPLRAVLGWFSRRGRFAIYTSDHRCIECGTCNRYCEMGIDIRMRARQGIPVRDTECVACGACIAVCPRYALSFFPFPSAEEAMTAANRRRFRVPFKRQLATPRER